MYQIKLGNYVLYDLRDEELILENPELSLEINKVGSLTFSIYPNHPYFDRINKLSSVITVLKNNIVIFKGRVISEEQGLYNSKKFECEGVLSYLNDSIVRPYSFTGSPEVYFKNLLANHNNQVIGNLFEKDFFNELNANIKDGFLNSAPAERTLYIKCDKNTTYTFEKLRGTTFPRFTIAETSEMPSIGVAASNSYYSSNEKDTYTTSSNAEYLVFWYYCNDSDLTHEEVLNSIKIVKGSINEAKVLKVGQITVTDPNDYITRSSINYASTWDILNEDLINKLGGYLKIRYESDGTYIDYLEDFNDTSTQIIEFGENLVDVLVKNDAIDVYTAVIPLGAEVENEDGTSEKLTIRSVNNGFDYIVNQEAYDYYGLIFAPVENTTWDDVTVPANLLTKGTDYLNNQAVMLKSSLELSAIDLNIVDSSIENFFIYEYVRFISSVHNINERYLLTKITIPISSPENMKITLGKETSSLTGIELGNKLNIDSVIQRVGRVESNYTIDSGKLNDLEKAVEHFSVDLSQYSIIVSADSNNFPYETKNYDVRFYGYYKGVQVIPNVTIENSNPGITVTKTDDYIRFAVNSNTALTNLSNDFNITFNYSIDSKNYNVMKTINVSLSLYATEELNNIREEVQTNITSIQQSQEEILMTALEDYVAKSEYQTFQEQISTEFSQTAEDFNFLFNNITSQITTIDGNTQQQFQEINKYIRFVDGNIILGESGNEITLKIENDRIAFIQNNNEVAYFSNNKLTVLDGDFLNSLKIGNFAFKPRANGNLSLVYVGGD